MQTRHHIRCKNKENHTPERPENTEPPKMTRRSHFPLLHAQGLGFPPPVGKGALHFCNPATPSGCHLLHFSDPPLSLSATCYTSAVPPFNRDAICYTSAVPPLNRDAMCGTFAFSGAQSDVFLWDSDREHCSFLDRPRKSALLGMVFSEHPTSQRRN